MAAENAAESKHQDAKAPESKAPKGDKVGLLVLGVVVLNTIAAGFMGLLLTKVSGRMKQVEEKSTALEERIASEEKKKETSPTGKEFVPPDLGVLYPMEGFLVNISSDRGSRFLQMKIELELDTPSLEDEISLKRPALRDAIIVLLTSRNYAELRDPKGMRRLRTDLLHSVNNLLKSGQVKEIYFTQFHFN